MNSNNHQRFDDIFGSNGNGDDTNYLTPEEYAERDTVVETPEVTSDAVLEFIATYTPGLEAETKLSRDLKSIQGEQRAELLTQLHQRLQFTTLVSKTAGADWPLFPNNGAYHNRVLEALSILEGFEVEWLRD